MSNLDADILKLSESEVFYSRLCQFLLMVKLCYGGSGVKAYFMRHKKIQKYMLKRLHAESLDIDAMFDTIISESI